MGNDSRLRSRLSTAEPGALEHRQAWITRKSRIGDRQPAQDEPGSAVAGDLLHVLAFVAQSRLDWRGLPETRKIVHHAAMFTSEAVTRGVRIFVRAEYAPERSQPSRNEWFFLYTVTISNEGSEVVQLLMRHWIVTDGSGHVEEYRGPGVVGKQPTLRPGESFEYTSGCPLPTPFGIMEGTYQMVTAEGENFDAKIAPFTLSEPYTVQH
jgi:ApaG protein